MCISKPPSPVSETWMAVGDAANDVVATAVEKIAANRFVLNDIWTLSPWFRIDFEPLIIRVSFGKYSGVQPGFTPKRANIRAEVCRKGGNGGPGAIPRDFRKLAFLARLRSVDPVNANFLRRVKSQPNSLIEPAGGP